MKHKIIVKQRNPFVVLTLKRKAGSHRKPFKAMRKAQNQTLIGPETLR
jgi:hypothetical protein